jgi:Uma2 family endonuclease
VAYKESNGYVIDEQGKPPDFVMEIASRRTVRQDIAGKRNG